MSSLEQEGLAAQVVLAKVRPILVSHAKNPKTIERELEPVFGFNWNKQLMIKVGSGLINDFLHCVKGTPFLMGKSTRPGAFSKGPFISHPSSHLKSSTISDESYHPSA